MSEDHGRADAKFLIGLFLGGIIGACDLFPWYKRRKKSRKTY